jgi:hypothetical protein
MNYLTSLGAVVSSKVTMKTEIHPQPRLYSIIVGESADDRKSESIRQTVNFFTETLRDKTDVPFRTCMGLGSAEGLSFQAKGVQDLLLVYDELKSFVSKAQIDGSILTPCINTLFDQNTFHSSTKKTSVTLDNLHLSMMGACTLDTYLRMWTPAFLDIGFINRLWLVTGKGERKFSIPKLIPDKEKDELRGELLTILKFVDDLPKKDSGRYAMPIEEDSLELFHSWYITQPENSPLTKRLDTYGHRFLLLLSINEQKKTITPEITKRVIDLLDWQLNVRKELEPDDCETMIAKIEKIIVRVLSKGPLRKRDLQQKCHYHRFGTYFWNLAIRSLKEDGQLISSKSGEYFLCRDDTNERNEDDRWSMEMN